MAETLAEEREVVGKRTNPELAFYQPSTKDYIFTDKCLRFSLLLSPEKILYAYLP